MKSKLDRLAPLGVNARNERTLFFTLLCLGCGWSILWFANVYSNAYDNLFHRMSHGRVQLIEGAMMVPFEKLIEGIFFWRWFLVLVCVFYAVLHYIYHFQGSKSIYLMTRLPKRYELLKRCVTLPLAGIIITFFTVFVLYMLFLTIYLVVTPAKCL